MCGNFGLIMLGQGTPKSSELDEFDKREEPKDAIDLSLHQSLHEVSRLHGLRVVGDANWTHNISSEYCLTFYKFEMYILLKHCINV